MQTVPASTGQDRPLVEQLNDDFTASVLPVTVFVGIETVLGFFGNLLVIYVFFFHYHMCNFKYFVLCLAFNDLTSTLTTMPGEIVTHLYWYVYPVEELCKVKSFFNMFTVAVEALCLLSIAVDRYRKVCRPFAWQIKPRAAIIVCFVIYNISLICAFPSLFLWGICSHQLEYKGFNITIKVCETDDEYQDSNHPVQYSVTMEVLLSVCLVAMIVLYIFVARTLLRKRAKESSKPSHAAKRSAYVPDGSSSGVGKNKAIPEHSDIGYSSSIDSDPTKQGVQRKKQSTGENNNVSPGQINNTSETGLSAKITGKCPLPTRGINHFDTIAVSDNGLTTDDDSELSTNEEESSKREQIFTLTTYRTFQSRSMRSHKGVRTGRKRRKTVIMIVLTVIFTVTTVLYLTLLCLIAYPVGILESMNNTERTVYFLFFRFYFVNHLINPIIYGILDPRFRQVLQKMKT